MSIFSTKTQISYHIAFPKPQVMYYSTLEFQTQQTLWQVKCCNQKQLQSGKTTITIYKLCGMTVELRHYLTVEQEDRTFIMSVIFWNSTLKAQLTICYRVHTAYCKEISFVLLRQRLSNNRLVLQNLHIHSENSFRHIKFSKNANNFVSQRICFLN